MRRGGYTGKVVCRRGGRKEERRGKRTLVPRRKEVVPVGSENGEEFGSGEPLSTGSVDGKSG